MLQFGDLLKTSFSLSYFKLFIIVNFQHYSLRKLMFSETFKFQIFKLKSV